MPVKKVSKVKNIDKLYNNFVKEVKKESKKFNLKPQKKQKVEIYDNILNFDSLEKERNSLVFKLYDILIQPSPPSKQIQDLFNNYESETQDTQFIIVLKSLDQTNLITLIEKLQTKRQNPRMVLLGHDNLLFYFKNNMVDSTYEERKNYVKYVEDEVDKTRKKILEEKKTYDKKNRHLFLNELYFEVLKNKHIPLIEQLSDLSLKDILEKLDKNAKLQLALTKYLEYYEISKDIDPLEFLIREHGEKDQEDQEDQEIKSYTKLIDKLKQKIEDEQKEEEMVDEDSDEDMPEIVYINRSGGRPLREIKVIITDEMKEKLQQLYRFVKKDIKKIERNQNKTATILGVNPICLNLQLHKPWIYKYSNSLIHTNDPTIIEKYTIPENIFPHVVLEGKKYYRPNKLFHILQCGYFSNKMRTQDDEILTLYEDAVTPVKFKVAHVLSNGSIIIQDKKLFDSEVKYINDRNVITDAEKILNSKLEDKFKVKEIIKRISQTNILNAILKTAEKNNLSVGEGDLNNYVNKIVENMLYRNIKKDVRDFLLDVANILVYMDARMIGDYASNFQQKLVKMFYKAEKIVDITPKVKFEEFYKNSKYSTDLKNRITQRIDFYKNVIVEELCKQIVYELLGRPTRQRDFDKIVDKLDLPLSDLKNLCKNKDLLNDSLSEYLVYQENNTGDIYCISLYNIGTENPYTGKPYPKSVLEELETLDQKFVNEYFNNLLYGESEEPLLAPNLIDFLIEDIRNMEVQLSANSDTQGVVSFCGYCNEYIKDVNSLKTVVRYDDKSKIVRFCKLKCFEDWKA